MVVRKYGLKLKFCNARKWMYRKNILRKNCLFPTFLIEKRRPFQNLSSHISLRVKTTIFQFRQKWNCNTWSLRKNILNGALKIVDKKELFSWIIWWPYKYLVLNIVHLALEKIDISVKFSHTDIDFSVITKTYSVRYELFQTQGTDNGRQYWQF